MKTFRIKLGDLRKFIREVYECGDMMPEMGGRIYNAGSAGPGESTGKTPMAETDEGPAWPHPWPKPKNSEILKAHRAVMAYLGPEQTGDLVMGKYALDQHHDGVVAVRLEDGGDHAGTSMDFIVYNCHQGCSDDDVEEVQFRSWPPNKSSGYR
jgi:hypothetical protein